MNIFGHKEDSKIAKNYEDLVIELKNTIEEKNMIIKDLKFIIEQLKVREPSEHSQSYQKLQESQGQQEILSINSQTQKTYPQKFEDITEDQEVSSESIKYQIKEILNSDTNPSSTVSSPLCWKDSLIKDLFHIVSKQTDLTKISTPNQAIREILTPSHGTYRFDDGSFEGELICGLPNGLGRTRLDNGDVYSGGYAQGKKNGNGIYRWANGDCYEGEHLNGQEHGKGTYKYADGDVYTGDYHFGKRHGFGVLKLKSGTTEYGYFKNGHYNGQCIMVSPDEQVVSIGDLKNNRQEGSWKFYGLKDIQQFISGTKI